MSVYQSFPTIAAALEAFAAGRCRRHVEVGGHVIDLVQAAVPMTVDDDTRTEIDWWPRLQYLDREIWDACVADAIAAELSGALPPLAPPEVPAPPVECCRACGRPLIGGGS